MKTNERGWISSCATLGACQASHGTFAGIRKLSPGMSHRIRCYEWRNNHIRFLVSHQRLQKARLCINPIQSIGVKVANHHKWHWRAGVFVLKLMRTSSQECFRIACTAVGLKSEWKSEYIIYVRTWFRTTNMTLSLQKYICWECASVPDCSEAEMQTKEFCTFSRSPQVRREAS